MKLRTLGVLATASLAGLAVIAPASASPLLPADVRVAVTGTNEAGYTWDQTNSKWQGLGGLLETPPAIVTDGTTTHYIASGINHRLYHRTDTTGWASMDGRGYWCTNVSAALSVDKQTVNFVCRGGNARVYIGSFAASDQHPMVTSLTNIGGQVAGTPALFNSPAPALPGLTAGPTIFARGANYKYGDPDTNLQVESNLYARNLSGGDWVTAGQFAPIPAGMLCSGDVAVATRGADIITTCQVQPGLMAVAWRTGTNLLPTAKGGYGLAGSYSGQPAVTYGTSGPMAIVQGTNGVIYTHSLEKVTKTFVGTPWSKLPGAAMGGISATTTPALVG